MLEEKKYQKRLNLDIENVSFSPQAYIYIFTLQIRKNTSSENIPTHLFIYFFNFSDDADDDNDG